MHFNNKENICLFNSFFENFGEILNSIIKDSPSTEIFTISSNHNCAGFIIGSDDYFATQPLFSEKNIAYSQENCDKINLNINEKYAFIAHEIGHIFDDKTHNANEFLIKEINADDMACKIGLQEDLICGLKKIIDGNAHKELTDVIKERISSREIEK